jgi:hypothetical protein
MDSRASPRVIMRSGASHRMNKIILREMTKNITGPGRSLYNMDKIEMMGG